MKQSPVQLTRSLCERYRFLGKRGKVVSFSTVATPPEGLHRQGLYVVAIVDFSGERATIPLADVKPSQVQVGMEVVGVLRRMVEPDKKELIVYGVKGVPLRKLKVKSLKVLHMKGCRKILEKYVPRK